MTYYLIIIVCLRDWIRVKVTIRFIFNVRVCGRVRVVNVLKYELWVYVKVSGRLKADKDNVNLNRDFVAFHPDRTHKSTKKHPWKLTPNKNQQIASVKVTWCLGRCAKIINHKFWRTDVHTHHLSVLGLWFASKDENYFENIVYIISTLEVRESNYISISIKF